MSNDQTAEDGQATKHGGNSKLAGTYRIASIAALIAGLFAPTAWVLKTSPALTLENVGTFMLVPLPFFAVATAAAKARERWYDV